MNIDSIVSKLNTLCLKDITWNNIFNIKKLTLDKDLYSREEVIFLLNEYENELHSKFLYYKLLENKMKYKLDISQYVGKSH